MQAPISIVFPLYPGVTQLDFTAPYEVLRRIPNVRCTVATPSGGLLEPGCGLKFADTVRLSEIEHCTVMCVPGGYGTIAMLDDLEYLAHLSRLGANARYVTSVCTGSLLLAAAGLVQGRRVGCHWAWRHLLVPLGAIPDPARIVRDDHVLTGGGVTAGIDLALAITVELAGPEVAELIALTMEYAPEPPFESGRPELARAEIVREAQRCIEAHAGHREDAVRRAAARLATHASGRGSSADPPAA